MVWWMRKPGSEWPRHMRTRHKNWSRKWTCYFYFFPGAICDHESIELKLSITVGIITVEQVTCRLGSLVDPSVLHFKRRWELTQYNRYTYIHTMFDQILLSQVHWKLDILIEVVCMDTLWEKTVNMPFLESRTSVCKCRMSEWINPWLKKIHIRRSQTKHHKVFFRVEWVSSRTLLYWLIGMLCHLFMEWVWNSTQEWTYRTFHSLRLRWFNRQGQ